MDASRYRVASTGANLFFERRRLPAGWTTTNTIGKASRTQQGRLFELRAVRALTDAEWARAMAATDGVPDAPAQ